MDYFKLALGLVTLLTKLLTYLRERDLLKAGESAAIANMMRTAASDIARASKAREEARASNGLVPKSSGLPDDGFRRD